METMNWLMNILKVALGLGFVIFLHELGHFLLAKWNGVKVEKFSIGFGPTIFGFTKGETEYVLAAVPLGGFVKMLGEGPDEEAAKSSDPRAFPNKSVWGRMQIISAGVIMNLILGLGCFIYAYKMGMDEIPTRIGSVKPASPAYEAGLRDGDEIVAIDGRRDLRFDSVTLKVRLSHQGQSLRFELQRPNVDGLVIADIEPRREPNADVPGIGIAPSLSLKLAEPPFRAPAGLAEPAKTPNAGLEVDDVIVAVGPAGKELIPITDILAYNQLIARYQAEPIDVAVERKIQDKDGKTTGSKKLTVTLPPNRFVDFGFRLKMEPVAAVRTGSPADKAGFRKGDVIVKVDDKDDVDPMRLPSLCYASAGKPMTFEVERAEPSGQPQNVTLTATPDDSAPWTDLTFPDQPVDVPGLGLAYSVRTKVEAVIPDSPAAKAGVKVGDVINKLTIPPIASDKSFVKPIEFTFDDKTPGWTRAFQTVQIVPIREVVLQVNNANVKLKLTPEPDPKWFHPERGVQLQYLSRRTPAMSVATAIQRGFDDTVDNILSIYAMLRSLVQGRVSPKGFGGPIMIAQVAYGAAGQGLTELVHFLGILSINLAVLNFLPIPPLDGGQMVFLIAEKVRGRPLPDSALIAGTYVGLLMVLSLMAFVIFQDVSRLVAGFF